MQKKNYFLVGLISLVLFSSIVSLILWKKSFFKKIQSYEIIGEFESINGLLENAVVKYRGYPVGRVTKIFPNTENPVNVSPDILSKKESISVIW